MKKPVFLIRATGAPRGYILVEASGSPARYQLVGKPRAARTLAPPITLDMATSAIAPRMEQPSMSVETQELAPPSVTPDESSAGPAPAIIIVGLPNWIFPSMNSVHFDNAGDIGLPAVGIESAIFTFTVPKGFNGVIKEIGNAFIGGGFTDGSGAIVWRVLQNNQAVRGKENLINSLGTVAIPSRIGGGGFIRVIENDIITMTVLNVSIAPAGQLVAGRLSGWFYPKDEDPQGIWF